MLFGSIVVLSIIITSTLATLGLFAATLSALLLALSISIVTLALVLSQQGNTASINNSRALLNSNGVRVEILELCFVDITQSV